MKHFIKSFILIEPNLACISLKERFAYELPTYFDLHSSKKKEKSSFSSCIPSTLYKQPRDELLPPLSLHKHTSVPLLL
jgi:hypothetical protein